MRDKLGILTTVLIMEAVNFFVYVFAAMLLKYEYVRLVSEAWYSHKLFIWSNLVLYSLHLIIFYSFHEKIFAVLNITKCVILFLIIWAQWKTKPKTLSKINRPSLLSNDAYKRAGSNEAFDYQEILRSQSSFMEFNREYRDNSRAMAFPSPRNSINQQRSSEESKRNGLWSS